MITKNFNNCYDDVKLELFRTYFSSLYMCNLWCKFKPSSHNQVRVAYNNVFRSLMHVKRGESISQIYVSNNVHGCRALERKLSYSFYTRVMISSNSLLVNLLSSVYFCNAGKLFQMWNSTLFIH